MRSACVARANWLLESQQGKEADVLLERATFGRTEHFAETVLATPGEIGGVVRARVVGLHEGKLQAEVIN